MITFDINEHKIQFKYIVVHQVLCNNTNTKFMQALFAVQTVFVFDVFNKDELMSDIREL